MRWRANPSKDRPALPCTLVHRCMNEWEQTKGQPSPTVKGDMQQTFEPVRQIVICHTRSGYVEGWKLFSWKERRTNEEILQIEKEKRFPIGIIRNRQRK